MYSKPWQFTTSERLAKSESWIRVFGHDTHTAARDSEHGPETGVAVSVHLYPRGFLSAQEHQDRSDLLRTKRLADRALASDSRAGGAQKWQKWAWFKFGVFRVTVRTMS